MKTHTLRGFAVFVILMLAQGLALAQGDSDGSYARLWRIDVMPGKSAEFQQAYDAHLQWRRTNGETWSWVAYRPVTGSRINSLYVRSGEHTLADMDSHQAFDAKASQQWNSTVDRFVKSYASWITKSDDEIVVWPDDLEPTLIQAYTYHLKPGSQETFNAALKKIHQGLVKVKWGEPYSVSRDVSGSPGNDVTLVLPYKNFADMAEPEKSFDAALAEAWGKSESARLMKDIESSYESVDEVLVSFDRDSSLILEN